MHVVIMGCGRVGSTLAESLDAAGKSVAVIDQESSAFRRLPAAVRRSHRHRRRASTARC